MFLHFHILIAFSFSILSSASVLFSKRQALSAQTTFDSFWECNAEEKAIIEQAHRDALVLANAALEDGRELLSTAGPGGKYVNFQSQAAIDYWGPPSDNNDVREYIFNTLYRATQTYRGFGFSDLWYHRYVSVYCKDIANPTACKPTVAAYQTTQKSHPYPIIVYCPAYFKVLKPHSFQVERIQADETGQLKLNTRNMRSQATTSLHEWLHIGLHGGEYSSEVCVGGCDDTIQDFGGEEVPTYKSGATKALARRNTSLAANTNDNYAYFATSLFMQKTFGVYPEYPTTWDITKTKEENQRIEAGQPGAPPIVEPWEMPDIDPLSEPASVIISAPFVPATSYPSWYQPIASAGATTRLPSVNVPLQILPQALAEPDINSVVCNSTGNLPLIEDCVHAFGALYQWPEEKAVQGHKGKTWWAGYVETCALAIEYTDDWTSDCNATFLDVQGHASAIFEGCQTLGGVVGGSVPFAVPNCPANITIIHTGGSPPSG